MKLRKIVITGSRDWKDRDAIWDCLSAEITAAIEHCEELLVIHGDCPTGADAIAEEFCKSAGVHTARVGALWSALGKKAGPRRNRVMAAIGPAVAYAFPLAVSAGTRDCIDAMGAAKVEVIRR